MTLKVRLSTLASVRSPSSMPRRSFTFTQDYVFMASTLLQTSRPLATLPPWLGRSLWPLVTLQALLCRLQATLYALSQWICVDCCVS